MSAPLNLTRGRCFLLFQCRNSLNITTFHSRKLSSSNLIPKFVSKKILIPCFVSAFGGIKYAWNCLNTSNSHRDDTQGSFLDNYLVSKFVVNAQSHNVDMQEKDSQKLNMIPDFPVARKVSELH